MVSVANWSAYHSLSKQLYFRPARFHGASLWDNSGNASSTQVMRDYLPVSDPLSIFAPQTSLYLLSTIGSLRHNKWNGVITRFPGLTSSRTRRFLFASCNSWRFTPVYYLGIYSIVNLFFSFILYTYNVSLSFIYLNGKISINI